MSDREHWATLPPDKLAGEITQRIDRFVDDALRYSMFERWRRMHCLTSGFDPDNDGLSWTPVISGKDGQIIRVRVNELLRYQRAHHVLVIGQRPAPQARPAAFDSRAIEVVPICNAIMDRAVGKLGGEEATQLANWYCQFWGTGWVSAEWDESEGRTVDGSPEGDVSFLTYRPDQVVFDTTLDQASPHRWIMLAKQWDRWELAAHVEAVQRAGFRAQMPQAEPPDEESMGEEMPEGPEEPGEVEEEPLHEWMEREIELMRNHILGASSNTRLDQQRQVTFRSAAQDDKNTSGQDTVWTYELHYPPSQAVPEGRYAMFLDGKILKDGPSIYSELPAIEHCAMRLSGTRWGYTQFWDLMGLQQVADANITAGVTVTENVGMSGVWIPPGSDGGEVVSVVEGQRIFKCMQPPQAVDFTGDAVQKLLAQHEYLQNQMTLLSGLNDTALGDTSSASSGKQAALNHALALQSASDYQASYVRLHERLYNFILRLYQTFSTTERVVQVAGRGNELAAKTFTSKDLRGIDGVDVELGAAILRTTAGVTEVADKLMTAQQINGQQYMALLSTKRLEPVFDASQEFEVHIDRENEMLSKGEEPTVARTDNHPLEMSRHAVVLNSPEARDNPAIVNAVVSHLMTHDREWMALTLEQPSLMMALGIPPHPMAQQQAAAAAMQQQPDQQPQGAALQGNPGEAPTNAQDGAARTIEAGGGGGVEGGTSDLPTPSTAPEMLQA